jgi:hypothetical protein
MQQEGAEERALPGAPQGELPLAVPRLEGAENPELDLLPAHHRSSIGPDDVTLSSGGEARLGRG